MACLHPVQVYLKIQMPLEGKHTAKGAEREPPASTPCTDFDIILSLCFPARFR